MKKSWIVGGASLVVVLFAGVLAVYFSLGEIARSMIEQHGSEMLGTKVTVDQVVVSPLDGYVAVRGLKVKNARGFKAKDIFELAEIVVRFDLDTLGDKPMVVKELTIIEPYIFYEMEFPEGNNMATIGRNIAAYQAKHGGKSTEPSDANSAASSEEDGAKDQDHSQGPRLVIKNFQMLRAELFSGTNVKNPTLQKFPDFHIENVGADTGGATPAEVAGIILNIIGNRMLGF